MRTKKMRAAGLTVAGLCVTGLAVAGGMAIAATSSSQAPYAQAGALVKADGSIVHSKGVSEVTRSGHVFCVKISNDDVDLSRAIVTATPATASATPSAPSQAAARTGRASRWPPTTPTPAAQPPRSTSPCSDLTRPPGGSVRTDGPSTIGLSVSTPAFARRQAPRLPSRPIRQQRSAIPVVGRPMPLPGKRPRSGRTSAAGCPGAGFEEGKRARGPSSRLHRLRGEVHQRTVGGGSHDGLGSPAGHPPAPVQRR